VSERAQGGNAGGGSGLVPELLVRDSDGEPRLVGGYSPTSDAYHFPLAELCPYSGADDVERRLLSATGTLWGWTAVNAPPPGYAGATPYGFGVVELPERIRVVTRLTEADPDRLTFGQTLHLVVEPVVTPDGDTLEIYAFAP